MVEKEKCYCGALATWIYMPGFSSGESPFVCDECVNRGCSCNAHHVREEFNDGYISNDPPPTDNKFPWAWIEEGKVWEYVDEKGRRYPCCEYEYSAEGFDKDTTAVDVLEDMLKNATRIL